MKGFLEEETLTFILKQEKKGTINITYGSFGYGERNRGGTVMLEFAMAYELMMAIIHNSNEGI